MSKTREIEMYAGDHGRYSTDFVEIPANTPEEQIETVALQTYQEQLEDQGAEIAIIGVHWILEPEED